MSSTKGVLGDPLSAEVTEGRVAVITGASHGIGAGMAARFSELGVRIGICARKRPEPPPRADRHHVVAYAADVRDSSDLEAFGSIVAERFGRIDLWVNNAGVIDPIGMVADVDPGMLAHLIDVNVNGVLNGARTFSRQLRRRPDGGVLVNISSGAATSVYPGWAGYCASKAAVDQLTRVVAVEEAAHGLRAYAVTPGMVDTAMQERIRATTPTAFPAVERFIEAKRAGAFNSSRWVADAILELAFGDLDIESGTVVRIPDESERETR